MALTKPQGDMVMKLGTEQATTSGTVIDFTGIPAGTTMIVVMLEGVSANGTSNLMVQIGDAGGVETTGYNGGIGAGDGTGGTQTDYSTGFLLNSNTLAANNYDAHWAMVLKDQANFTWSGFGVSNRNDGALTMIGSGNKSLSATLDRVRLTSVSADTFDAGSINIAYF